MDRFREYRPLAWGTRAPGPPGLCPAARLAFPWCLGLDPTMTGASFPLGAQGLTYISDLKPLRGSALTLGQSPLVLGPCWPLSPFISTRSRTVKICGCGRSLWKLPQVMCK